MNTCFGVFSHPHLDEIFYSLKIDNKYMRQLKITKSITNRESASLDKYLQEIGREDLITAEIEVELAQRIKAGDEIALEKLVIVSAKFSIFCFDVTFPTLSTTPIFLYLERSTDI